MMDTCEHSSLGSSSKNGTRGSFRLPLPLRRIARCLWPRQSRGPGQSIRIEAGLAHRLWGTCGLTRSDRRDGDGKAPGRQVPNSEPGNIQEENK